MILRRVMAALAVVGLVATGPAITTIEPPYRNALEYAIHGVETNWKTGPIIGDGGASRGPMQISKPFFQDSGCEFAYEKVDDLEHALIVFRKYMDRYVVPYRYNKLVPEVMCLDEFTARTQVGGPRGPWRESSKPYWTKVQAIKKEFSNE